MLDTRVYARDQIVPPQVFEARAPGPVHKVASIAEVSDATHVGILNVSIKHLCGVRIAALTSAQDLAPLIARLQLAYGGSILFSAGSGQDLDNSEQIIAQLDQGGLSLPNRDYYAKDDAKSKETRERFLQHAEKVFMLLGENAAAAKQDAATLMRLETALAKASQTEVERRDPYKLKHTMTLADLNQTAPKFDWKAYYSVSQYPAIEKMNVGSPDFFKQVNTMLVSEPIANWKTYLRFHIVNSASPFLSAKFVDENFDFYRKYLRGAKEQQDRWKRCVSYVDHTLDDALSQVYVARVFGPELKARTLDMVQRIEAAMELRIRGLDWMSPATKEQALVKLHGIRNKIGYPDKWRDYSSITIARGDFAGNMERAAEFESHRQINKIGKPVDHGEWQIPATTVDAYYDPQMNDINFPAGVLQPPLFDPKMDDAPNYGNTGGTVGHELTHGFDDEGSQFDAKGNLRNWWTKEDREKFDARTKGVKDQYAQYVVVDDVTHQQRANARRRRCRSRRRNSCLHGLARCDERQKSGIDRRTLSGPALFHRLRAMGLRQRAAGANARSCDDRSSFTAAIPDQWSGGEYAGIRVSVFVQAGLGDDEARGQNREGLVEVS